MRPILQILNHTCTASKRNELLNSQMPGKIRICMSAYLEFLQLLQSDNGKEMARNENNISVLQLYSYVYS